MMALYVVSWIYIASIAIREGWNNTPRNLKRSTPMVINCPTILMLNTQAREIELIKIDKPLKN